jgi:hypothetical protein
MPNLSRPVHRIFVVAASAAVAIVSLEQHDDPTYQDDAVEIFINPDPKQEVLYYGFEMNARAER